MPIVGETTYGCSCNCATFREHVGNGPYIGAAARPTRDNNVQAVTDREAQLTKDLPAYKRLRQDGLQPKHVGGSADLEKRATDSFEVETGHIYPDKKNMPIYKELDRQLRQNKKAS